MKFAPAAAALFAATVVADKRDLCSEGSVDIFGNSYCQLVNAITYTGVGGDGSYNKVTDMPPSGECASTPFGYSGSMSPLDEEVSMHFRGPMYLKQFAVYTPGAASSKKSRRAAHAHRHAHRHAHAHAARNAAVGTEVTATINGIVQSWVNEYTGEATTAPAADAASTPAAASDDDSSSSSGGASGASDDSSPVTSGSGWARQGYYDAPSSTSQGLVFLNHQGGSGSGTFDDTYGNSLSYASSDGMSGSATPQTLADTTFPSSGEVVIMSDQPCGDNNGDCGYYRPDTVAYHGFAGASKAFFFEFQMPSDGQTTASEYDAVNMPAIWMLNAQIPRTLQYGLPACSCWTSGCGEFDIFEVLAPGSTKCKSTLHGNIAGGDSDYFSRPESNTTQAALVMFNNNIHIKVLDTPIDFGSAMDEDTINDIISSTSTQNNAVSLFSLAGLGGD